MLIYLTERKKCQSYLPVRELAHSSLRNYSDSTMPRGTEGGAQLAPELFSHAFVRKSATYSTRRPGRAVTLLQSVTFPALGRITFFQIPAQCFSGVYWACPISSPVARSRALPAMPRRFIGSLYFQRGRGKAPIPVPVDIADTDAFN